MQAAFFDVDGTLAASNVVLAYLHFLETTLPKLRYRLELAKIAPRILYYALLDQRDRSRFNEVFFKNYAGVRARELDIWARDAVRQFWIPRLYPAALNRMEQHRAQGCRIILISGGLEPVLTPLAQWLKADRLQAVQMEIRKDQFTGTLLGQPLTGTAKADAVRKIASDLDLDLTRSYAYADSYTDHQFLAAVGYPVTVNPDRKLRRLGQKLSWPSCWWQRDHHKSSGTV